MLRAGCVLCALVWAGCSSGPAAECTQESDCPAGRYCRVTTGECVFDCTFHSDCPDGYRCTPHGRCKAGCVPSNGGQEACDGVDNDCDGQTDEDFPDVGTACSNGGCAGEWVCAADGSAQECDAPAPAADDATCDGVDEDCDGQTDEDAADRDCPVQAGVCAGARQTCLHANGWSECDYGPDYTELLDEICDQLDNDCDGQTDEDASYLLSTEVGPQASDGLDNNCNGLVDEPGGLMIPLPPPAVGWIDAYEASVWSQPDCAGTAYGQITEDYPAGWPAEAGQVSVELYACSLGGVIPSGWLSWHRAQRACAAQGKSLCTESTWSQACHGGLVRIFPYGTFYMSGMCNDAWSGSGQVAPTGSWPDCTTGLGEFDMSGNLTEWIREPDPEIPGDGQVGALGFLCTLCRNGSNCHTCVDPDDQGDMFDALNCDAASQSQERFPLEFVRADMGARCCILP